MTKKIRLHLSNRKEENVETVGYTEKMCQANRKRARSEVTRVMRPSSNMRGYMW